MSRVFLGGLVVLTIVLAVVLSESSSSDDTDASPTSESATDNSAHNNRPTATGTDSKRVGSGSVQGGNKASVQVQNAPSSTAQRIEVALAPSEKAAGPSGRLKRPFQVAGDALRALKDGDFESLLLLVPAARIEGVRERWGKGTQRYDELFGPDGWQQQSIQEWNGELLSQRVKYNAQALVKYGELIEDGVTKHLCVSLLNIEGDGNWYFKDLDARPDESFIDYGEAVQPDFESPPPVLQPSSSESSAEEGVNNE